MRIHLARLSVIFLVAGCPAGAVDEDGDGSPATLDCDDNDAERAPGLREMCNGKDNNCNGVPDDNASDAVVWYRDRDGDEFGDKRVDVLSCTQPEGHVTDDTDCDDSHDTAHPGAEERCDGIDNDCDDETDEDSAVDAPTWYIDGDGDKFGDEEVVACAPPEGAVSNPGDCNDERKDIYPNAPELCDGDDNDCDDAIDEEPVDSDLWWPDTDKDGHGTGEVGRASCTAIGGMANNNDDCDDTDPRVAPSLEEQCDGVDNDCNPGTTEDGLLALDDTPHATLASAMAAATGGETLHICEGTWSANLDVSTDLDIQGHGGSAQVILEASRKRSVITVTAGAALSVSGLTITKGDGDHGGAIDAWSGGSLAITDSVLHNNISAGDGGAVRGPSAALTSLVDTEVYENLAVGTGGGVYANSLTTERVRFEANEATTGGGAVASGADATLDADTLFFENVAKDGGGFAMLTAHQVSGAEFDGNEVSGDGGALWLAAGASAFESNCHDNIAVGRGGAIFAKGDATIESAVMSSNLAATGGAVAALAGEVQLSTCEVEDNTADDGAGIAVLGASVTVRGGTVLRNEATRGGGAWVSSGDLESSSADWGTKTNDNIDDDVYVGTTSYTSYAAGASFVCTADSGTCK